MMYFMYLNRDMNFKSIRFRWFEETSRIRSRIQWNEWERGLVTTQTKFNRGLHAGITQDRDLSRGRWANPRRFESSLFAAAAAAAAYLDFPKITLKRRSQFPPWISNIEDGSCRLSSLHRILAHRYSVSIERSLNGWIAIRALRRLFSTRNSIFY